ISSIIAVRCKSICACRMFPPRDIRLQSGPESFRFKKRLSWIVMAYDAHLADRIRSILTGIAPFSEKKMFGGLTFLINGRMCCGVLKDDLVLRLTPKHAALALRQPHTRSMDFTGKPMKSMIH